MIHEQLFGLVSRSKHEADHGEANECGGSVGVAFELPHQPSIATDPRERPLDNPTLWQDDKAVSVRSFDDFNFPASGRANHRCRPCSRVATIGKDALDEWEAGTGPLQKVDGCRSVLNVGRQHGDVQQKSERVNEDMALASRDLLTCVIALRVQRRAPF